MDGVDWGKLAMVYSLACLTLSYIIWDWWSSQ